MFLKGYDNYRKWLENSKKKKEEEEEVSVAIELGRRRKFTIARPLLAMESKKVKSILSKHGAGKTNGGYRISIANFLQVHEFFTNASDADKERVVKELSTDEASGYENYCKWAENYTKKIANEMNDAVTKNMNKEEEAVSLEATHKEDNTSLHKSMLVDDEGHVTNSDDDTLNDGKSNNEDLLKSVITSKDEEIVVLKSAITSKDEEIGIKDKEINDLKRKLESIEELYEENKKKTQREYDQANDKLVEVKQENYYKQHDAQKQLNGANWINQQFQGKLEQIKQENKDIHWKNKLFQEMLAQEKQEKEDAKQDAEQLKRHVEYAEKVADEALQECSKALYRAACRLCRTAEHDQIAFSCGCIMCSECVEANIAIHVRPLCPYPGCGKRVTNLRRLNRWG